MNLARTIKVAGAALGAGVVMCATATPARAQAFADLKTALVDYSKADLAPRKACEALGKFKSKDIVQISAAMMPAAGAAPAHCRVTGLLSPEIAFEVSLPAKWNGRFYMIGNGGLAGEAMDDPGRVAQRNAALNVGFRVRADQHGPRRAQRSQRNLCAEQSGEGDRLRLARCASDGRDHEGRHEGLLWQGRFQGLLELLLQRRAPGFDRGAAFPRGFRRHCGQRAVVRSDGLHDRRDVESESAHRERRSLRPRWRWWPTG